MENRGSCDVGPKFQMKHVYCCVLFEIHLRSFECKNHKYDLFCILAVYTEHTHYSLININQGCYIEAEGSPSLFILLSWSNAVFGLKCIPVNFLKTFGNIDIKIVNHISERLHYTLYFTDMMNMPKTYCFCKTCVFIQKGKW